MIAEIIYKEYIIQIYEYKERKYSFEMLNLSRSLLCNIALWPLKSKFYFENGNLIHNQQNSFGDNDYYQDNMTSTKIKMGYCSTLQEFFITKSQTLNIKIDNIYSSFEMTLDPGIKFWKSQVKKGKAEYVNSLKRYKLIINRSSINL